MEADWVGAVWRTGAEDARQGPRRIATRVDGQNVASGAVEPCQEQHLLADVQVAQRFGNSRIEHEPCLRGAFIPLRWGGLAVDQWRFHPADGIQCVGSSQVHFGIQGRGRRSGSSHAPRAAEDSSAVRE